MNAGALRRAMRRATIRSYISVGKKNLGPELKHYSCWLCVLTVGFLFFIGFGLFFLPEPLTLDVFGFGRTATLLIWTHPFGWIHELPDCSALYEINGCTLTDDWEAYPHADAVIIHHREVGAGAVELPPEPRPHDQKWIWMNFESPSHTPRLWRFEGVFNLTMSYRVDSDIFLPYGYLIPPERKDRGVQERLHAQPLHAPSSSELLRPHVVAWVVSNWVETHARVIFYHELRKHIEVDVFGRRRRPLPKDCGNSVERLVRRYQFYLALENSQHTDYITEKLWNAIQAGAIPVVLGPPRQNYERFLPPDAFIHVDDFPSVQGLAQYLLMLRRTPSLLKRHLDWRRSYSFYRPVFWGEQYCSACREVKRRMGNTSVVTNLNHWFHL